jgi:ribosome maturation factor RimP
VARRRKKKGQFFDDDETSSKKAPSYSPQVLDKIEGWAEEGAQANDLVLFDLEVVVKGRWIIRAYVDLPGEVEPGEGVGVDQCAKVSRYLEAYLDAATDVPENYVLEVSTPGVERRLRKPKHLRQAVGEKVQLIVRQQVASRNKVIGELVDYEDDTLEVRLEDDPDQLVDIDWANVKEARLKHDFDF